MICIYCQVFEAGDQFINSKKVIVINFTVTLKHATESILWDIELSKHGYLDILN